MKASLMTMISVGAFVLLSLASELVRSDDPNPTTKKWYVPPNKGGYAPGDVAYSDSKGHNGEGTVDKNNKQSQMTVAGKGNYNAGEQGTAKAAQATNPKGYKASGDQSKFNINNGHQEGDYNGAKGNRHGDLDNKRDNQHTEFNGKSKSGKTEQSYMSNDKKDFKETGPNGGVYEDKPESQDKNGGKGTVSNKGKVHKYTNQRASDGSQTATLDNVNPKGGAPKTYNCRGQSQAKSGTSSCTDQQGNKYGEVVQQPDGTVIVKKTIAKGVDVPVGKAVPVKGQNGQNYVTLNDGQFKAQCSNTRQRDCMSDYGKSGSSKIKIEKPITVKPNSQHQEGQRTTFQFPDCFTISAKLTLPPGMDANRLAVQVDANILPAGKLKCIDTGACRRDCYYCNFCNSTRKATVAANSDTRNLCASKGGGTYQVTFTVCPPPEAFNKDMCTGFTKSDPTYFKRSGDVQCKLLFWERPANEQELTDKYYNTVEPNNILKTVLLAQYKAENIIPASGNPQPTSFDLCQFYIKKNGAPDQLVGCTEGTANYTVSSQKVRTDFLLEAGSLAAAPKSLIDTKPCPKVDAANQQEAQQDQQDAKSRQPKGGSNPWGNIANQFGSWGGKR